VSEREQSSRELRHPSPSSVIEDFHVSTLGSRDQREFPPYFVCGPTASGKTAYAIAYALQNNGEIVNGDAFQLYRGLEVLSAAPSAEEQLQVPHHLYGVLSPSQRNDAQAYVDMALPVIREIQARGKTPVVTGGSGLYLKFLTHGASPLPTGDADLRAELDARSLDDLVAQLEALDPLEASRTALKNRRYVSRALEICLLTGEKASTLRDDWQSASVERESQLAGCFLQRTRPDLQARIAMRSRIMLDSGAIEEVAALPEDSPTCGKAIGVKEIRALLAGEINRATCEELLSISTRQYAKRQETWFKREKWLKIVHI
jgi:tRNA dimethylallyltransferase